MYFKSKHCEVNKESNLHVEDGIFKTCKLPKRSKYAKIALTAF
jgi:hypothetical protein